MNIRELLARLNPKTCRFDIGQGGVPTLTNIDIAGALGMVPHGMGRELLIYLHWPDGARVDRKQLLQSIADATRAEMAKRDSVVSLARLALHVERERWAEKANHTEYDRRTLDRAVNELAKAKVLAWPHDGEMHARLRNAVLDEMSTPNLCKDCDGRGHREVGTIRIVCPGCSGRGTVPVSDRQRADRLQRDESSYRKSWRSMYEWTWLMLNDEEQQAAEALALAMGWSRNAAA